MRQIFLGAEHENGRTFQNSLIFLLVNAEKSKKHCAVHIFLVFSVETEDAGMLASTCLSST